MGIARLFLKKLYFFQNNLFLLFCIGLPLYFCEFLLKYIIYNIAQYNIAHYFLINETVPWMLSDAAGAYSDKISCCAPLVQDPRGLFRQNLLLRPAGPRSPGLIPTKSLATPRWSEIPGAYSGKIFCYAPLVRFLQGTDSLNPISIPSSAQIHKNTDGQISSLSISIFVCQYLFHQQSVTAGSPSHPRTPAAFLRKEP